MWLLGLSLAFALSVTLLLWRVIRQSRRYQRLHLAEAAAPGNSAAIAIVVPARNEGLNIETCLRSLANQSYPAGKLRIVVVDDSSADDTAGIVRRCAAADDRIALIEAPTLPAGWTGKSHACWQGALAADAPWLCFVDADTIAEPPLVGTAVAAAERQHLDMLSLEPFQELTGFHDRLVIPLGFLAIAATRDVARLNGEKAQAVEANGQFILCRSEAYFAVGGHAAIRHAICEDAALARRFKAAGLGVAVLGGETLIRTRLYRNGRDLWEGLSKNLTEVFGGIGRTLAVAIGALLIGGAELLLPIAAGWEALRDPHPLRLLTWLIAVLAAVALFATQIALVRYFRIPRWYGLIAPLGALAGALIAISAVVSRLRRRVRWKGRDYVYSRP